MDNIQKLIVGVLGVSGLLAMLTPSSVPVIDGSNPTAAAPAISPPSLADIEGGEPLVDEAAEAELPDDGDDFTLGEPSIDGNPIGATGQQQQYQPDQTPQPDYSQPAYSQQTYSQQTYSQPVDYGAGNVMPQGAAPAQNYAPSPEPVPQVPVNMGN